MSFVQNINNNNNNTNSLVINFINSFVDEFINSIYNNMNSLDVSSNKLDCITNYCNEINCGFNYLKKREIGGYTRIQRLKNKKSFHGFRLAILGDNCFVKMWHVIDNMHKNKKKIFITPYLDSLNLNELKSIEHSDLIFLIDLVQSSHVSYVKEFTIKKSNKEDSDYNLIPSNRKKEKNYFAYPASIKNICFVSPTCKTYAQNYWKLYQNL